MAVMAMNMQNKSTLTGVESATQNQTPPPMPMAWRIFFIIFVSLLAIGIVLTALPFLGVANQTSDAGLAVVVMEVILMPVVALIALATVVGLVVYKLRYKSQPSGRRGLVWLALKTLLVGVGLLFVALGAYVLYHFYAGW